MKRKKTLSRLVEQLRHPDSSIRRAAAQELADWDERAAYPLINALRDANPGVQDAAMRSLVRIGGEAVAYMVIPLLREESLLRNTALLILKELGLSAVQLLYPLLADRDSDIRKFALDLLGDIRDGVDPSRMLPLFKDPNANVRASAIRAVGQLEYSAGLPDVRAALGDEEWVAFAALETIAQFRDAGAVDHIIALLSSDSTAIRISALECLGAIGDGRAAAVLVRHIETTSDLEERLAALKSLVLTGNIPATKEIGDLLTEMFRVSDWDDRMVALRGLASIRYENALEDIIDATGALDESVPGQDEVIMGVLEGLKAFGPSDKYIKILSNKSIRYKGRVIAAEVAGETGSVSAVPTLISLLKNDLRDVRQACAMALGQLSTKDAVAALMDAVADPESNVRKMAIRSLGRSSNAAAFDLLFAQLNRERYDDIIEECVRSLMAIDDDRLYCSLDSVPPKVRETVARSARDLEVLLKLSNDSDRSVSLAALATLGKHSDKRALARVLDALRSDDPDARRTAISCLGEMDAAQESIKPLLTDRDMWVRLHAVRTLGQSMKQEMVEALRPMLSDPDVPVVLATIEAISMIGGKEAFKALAAVAQKGNEQVRAAAEEALKRLS